jgi:hypothetical protein
MGLSSDWGNTRYLLAAGVFLVIIGLVQVLSGVGEEQGEGVGSRISSSTGVVECTHCFDRFHSHVCFSLAGRGPLSGRA